MPGNISLRKAAHASTAIDDITGPLVRRHSTAAVLLHHTVAEQLGVGPTDLKCLDLVRERGTMTGSRLAAITGLTSGAITGVAARLEQAGFLSREPDPEDGRKQLLCPVVDRMPEIHAVFDPIREEMAGLLRRFDAHQLSGIAEYLTVSTDAAYRHMALLRARFLSAGKPVRRTTEATNRAERAKLPGGKRSR